MSAPAISQSAATAITSTSATLQGFLDDDGGQATDVTWFWGTTNGGTNAAAWAFSGDMGAVAGGNPITWDLSGLHPGTIYYFRVRAVNGSGTVWSSLAFSRPYFFSTLGTFPPILAKCGSRMPAKIGTVGSGHKWGDVACVSQYNSSWPSGIVIPSHNVNNATLHWAGYRGATPTGTRWETSGLATYAPTSGPSGGDSLQVLMPLCPTFSGGPDPSAIWLLRKGSWKFTASVFVDSTMYNTQGQAPPCDYDVHIYVSPRRVFSTGGNHYEPIYSGSIASGAHVFTGKAVLSAVCQWQAWVQVGCALGVVNQPTGTLLCSVDFTAQRA